MAAIYDRRVSAEFLKHFDPNDTDAPGVASSLVSYAKHALYPVDLQFRHTVRSGLDHATLYVGLTSVLDLHMSKKGLLKLAVHATHAKAGGFDPAWSQPQAAADLAAHWPEVELYLDRIIPIAARTHGSTEGAVQAAVSSRASSKRVILDREVTPSFGSTDEKTSFMKACASPILEALKIADLGFAGMPTKLGNECDAIGVDQDGTILAIEVKPLGVGSIAWAPAQATMYARILQRWIDESASADNVPPPANVLKDQLEQRRSLGLVDGDFKVGIAMRVAPVVVLQRGASAEMIRRMLAVRDALKDAPLGVEPIQLFEVNLLGDLLPLSESRLPDGRPRPQNYAAAENARQARWKASSSAPLPLDARGPGQVRNRSKVLVDVDYALPAEHAVHNLLPEVRQQALDMFKNLKIGWHQGIAGGPSAHLRSSQVQCVNALTAMASDPDRIIKAFGSQLDIATVRDFGEIDPTESGRFLTFEFIGLTNYFNEGSNGKRVRGSQCTSVDAAFAYVTSTGKNALALVEWKYTENYPSAAPTNDAKHAERLRRYENLLKSAKGPIKAGRLDLADLFHEPIYQLVRQQLLADQLRSDSAVAAEVVRVIHVLSPDNNAYQRSYLPPALRGRGATVSAVWKTLLRHPDRFVTMDPTVFLDPAVTSEHYVDRYGSGSTN
ncbi:hypothetical protein [Nocardioides sp. GCM10030258]|uniref:PGN_0703 family putative restriction endonuclease n=1 Tax=unclassified Nocardioides TaxID=2615069 RepID=UPI0036136DB5